MSQPEMCFCSHSFWDHVLGRCQGDLGACECTEFIWLGEEEEDDDEETDT